MILNENELKEFLVEAKKRCYAGNGEEVQPCRPMSRDLPFRKGDLFYLDSYLGELSFIGEEVVWNEGRPVWGMNFYGELLTESVPGVFDNCLKGALKMLPFDAPFRGPKHFSCGELEYRCSWDGGMDCFSGEEIIVHQEKVIYRLRFHGGYLKF